MTRIVEPYSLVFKRRRDGVGREYLYVWDRTGGRRSGPGIKTLLHDKIQSLAMLDETFELRFEVLLAKAGDFSQSGYFAGRPRFGTPHSSTAYNRAAYNRAATGPRYIVQCAFCSKTFTRNKNSTALNPHKNPWGSPLQRTTGVSR